MAETAPTEATPLLQPDHDGSDQDASAPAQEEVGEIDTREEIRLRRANSVVLASIGLGLLVVAFYVVLGIMFQISSPWWFPYHVMDAIHFIFFAAVAGTISSVVTWAWRHANAPKFNSNPVLFTIDVMVVGIIWGVLPSVAMAFVIDSSRTERHAAALYTILAIYIVVAAIFSILQATIVVLRVIAAYRFRRSAEGQALQLIFPSFDFSIAINIRYKRTEGGSTTEAITGTSEDINEGEHRA